MEFPAWAREWWGGRMSDKKKSGLFSSGDIVIRPGSEQRGGIDPYRNRSREPSSWHENNKISHDDASVVHETGD